MIHPTKFSESVEQDSPTVTTSSVFVTVILGLYIQRLCGFLGKGEKETDREAVIITGDSHRTEGIFSWLESAESLDLCPSVCLMRGLDDGQRA